MVLIDRAPTMEMAAVSARHARIAWLMNCLLAWHVRVHATRTVRQLHSSRGLTLHDGPAQGVAALRVCQIASLPPPEKGLHRLGPVMLRGIM